MVWINGRYGTENEVTGTTTNAYVTPTDSTVDTLNKSTVSFAIHNDASANALKWKVLASNDASGNTPVEIQAEASVAADAAGTYGSATPPYRYYYPQVKDDASGNNATFTIYSVVKA